MAKAVKNKATSKKPAPKPIAAKTPKTKDKHTAKIPAETTVAKGAKTTSPVTDDAKRLDRNKRLREWRATHVDQQRAYMADWRIRRKAKMASNTPSSGKAEKSTIPATDTTRAGGV